MHVCYDGNHALITTRVVIFQQLNNIGQPLDNHLYGIFYITLLKKGNKRIV